jgi:hypothetical protein
MVGPRPMVGRVLDVNGPRQDPLMPKDDGLAGDLNDRCHWGSLGDVAASN